jgi:predicted RNA-binding protein YlxR (DUF448 family)
MYRLAVPLRKCMVRPQERKAQDLLRFQEVPETMKNVSEKGNARVTLFPPESTKLGQ